MQKNKARVVAIIGESGGGKSTLAKALVASDPRVIVAAPYMKTPYDTTGFTDYAAAKAAFLAHRDVKTFRVSIAVYDPKELAQVCRLAWALAPCTLVLDESSTVIPNAQAAPKELRLIAQVGRHAGHDEEQPVRLVALGQRPANLPPFLLSEAREVYVFPLTDEDDCYKVAEDFSLPRELRDGVAERIARLSKFHRLRLTKRDDGRWAVHEGTGT